MTEQLIAFLGDVHGNASFLKKACEYAKKTGAERLIQLGDFGLWWPSRFNFTDYAAELARTIIPIDVIPGNHENYNEIVRRGALRGPDPVECSPGFRILPRGCKLKIGETTFLTLGGAFSIDKEFRTENSSWWPQETITNEDVDFCLSQGKADVMLSHDTILDVPFLHLMNEFKMDETSKSNRELVQKVFEACDAQYLFHGHWHVNYRYELPDFNSEDIRKIVLGLADDSQPLHQSLTFFVA